MLSSNVTHKRHDLKAGGRIQSTGRLVKEQNLRVCDELTGYAQTTLLTTADAFSNRSPYELMSLALDAKRVNQAVNPRFAFLLRNGPI